MSEDRPIAGAFSPLYPYDGSLEWTVGTLERPMELRWDWRNGRRVFVPIDREHHFWVWFLDNRPDLAREASERHLAALEGTRLR